MLDRMAAYLDRNLVKLVLLFVAFGVGLAFLTGAAANASQSPGKVNRIRLDVAVADSTFSAHASWVRTGREIPTDSVGVVWRSPTDTLRVTYTRTDSDSLLNQRRPSVATDYRVCVTVYRIGTRPSAEVCESFRVEPPAKTPPPVPVDTGWVANASGLDGAYHVVACVATVPVTVKWSYPTRLPGDSVRTASGTVDSTTGRFDSGAAVTTVAGDSIVRNVGCPAEGMSRHYKVVTNTVRYIDGTRHQSADYTVFVVLRHLVPPPEPVDSLRVLSAVIVRPTREVSALKPGDRVRFCAYGRYSDGTLELADNSFAFPECQAQLDTLRRAG